MALKATSGGLTGQGNYTVNVVAPAAPTATLPVDVVTVNPGTSISRHLCLTVAVGDRAAMECGDLRIVHPLPATRTLSKMRAPTLVYNSQHAHPHMIIAANARTTSSVDSVTAILRVNGVIRDQRKWAGSHWGAGSTRRIALAYDALSDSGLYPYTLEVKTWKSGASTTYNAPGEFVVVNRSQSPFGAGWWLAGLERLDPATMLWTGGDGSTRKYVTAGANVWVAPRVERPDTLRWNGTHYIRKLPGAVEVRFNANGEHVSTIDRIAQRTTTFVHTGGRLQTITLAPTGSGKTYTFSYHPDGRLNTITAPPAGAKPRVTTLSYSGATRRVTAITEPDGRSVQFGDSGNSRIRWRTDRRGFRTGFDYANGRLSRSYLAPGNGQDSIVLGLRPLEAAGLGPSSVDTARAYTLVDGPRVDVGDTTAYFLDRFGAPRRIRDALGNVTVLRRTDPDFPALVTSVLQPNGFSTRAVYTRRGNLATVRQVNPYGDNRDATTRYEWDSVWPDFVKRIIVPEGNAVAYGYDASGNRIWEQPGGATDRRVQFHVNALGLVTSTRLPSQAVGARDSVEYNALGNLSATRTPRGFWTLYDTDTLGRDTAIITPVDTISARNKASLRTAGLKQRLHYDLAGRIDTTWTVASGEPTLLVVTQHDAEDNVTSIARISQPDSWSIGWITNTAAYDGANRKVIDVNPGSRPDTMRYDGAGNLIHFSRTGSAMQYDALNRLTLRWSSADSARFSHDEMGNLRSATNRSARVTRSYYPGGALKADTLKVQTLTHANVDSTWSGFTAHVFPLLHHYDLNGRRVRLDHPPGIAPSGVGVRGYSTYGYDAVTGGIGWVEGLAVGSRFDFQYNRDGQLDTLRYPAGVVNAHMYDPDGMIARRTLRVPAGATRSAWSPYDDRYVYDARGKSCV